MNTILLCLSLWSGLPVPAAPLLEHRSLEEIRYEIGQRLPGRGGQALALYDERRQAIVVGVDDDKVVVHAVWHHFQRVYGTWAGDPGADAAARHYMSHCRDQAAAAQNLLS